MAEGTDIVNEIDQAVASLSETLYAKFVNFFDRPTLQDLERPRGNLRYLIVTGTYAYGEWRYGDDVRLVCMTENAESTFWSYVAEKLKLKESTDLPSNGVMELSSPAFSRTSDGTHGSLAEFATLSRKDKVRRISQTMYSLHRC